MPIAQNQELLDYVGGGYPFMVTVMSGVDGDGLDLVEGGSPGYASLGEVSTSIMRATQVVTEVLRDNTDPGGGNLRTTQVVAEYLIENDETIYVTQIVNEILSQSVGVENQLARGKSWMVFDEENHLDVIISYGDPPTSAANDLAVLNGANMALWGQELLQFRDVTSLGGNLYRLSHLLRGRFGTEVFMNSHSIGDQFILIDFDTAKRVSMVDADINILKFYRGVTIGMLLQSAITRGFANTAAGLKPYAPCFVLGARDGSDNLTITWTRRARFGAEWLDGDDVPLAEASEEYEVDILDSSGTVVRTLDGLTTASASYTAAQQTTDFGSPQALISIVVYQISAIVGRGYGTRISV